MKVIVQIPCDNEEATLPQTLAEFPRQIEGVDEYDGEKLPRLLRPVLAGYSSHLGS